MDTLLAHEFAYLRCILKTFSLKSIKRWNAFVTVVEQENEDVSFRQRILTVTVEFLSSCDLSLGRKGRKNMLATGPWTVCDF